MGWTGCGGRSSICRTSGSGPTSRSWACWQPASWPSGASVRADSGVIQARSASRGGARFALAALRACTYASAMLSRRTFLTTAASLAFAPTLRAADPPRKKLAVVTTVWRYRSHAWHMAERFLAGYPVRGQLAPAAVRGRLGLRRSDAEGRPEPRAGQGVRLHDLPDDRRGPALRRRQAGRRCRARSSASTATTRRTRSARRSTRATSSSSRSPTSSEKDGRVAPGLQRQAPVVEVGVGQGDGRHRRADEVPVPGRARRCR